MLSFTLLVLCSVSDTKWFLQVVPVEGRVEGARVRGVRARHEALVVCIPHRLRGGVRATVCMLALAILCVRAATRALQRDIGSQRGTCVNQVFFCATRRNEARLKGRYLTCNGR